MTPRQQAFVAAYQGGMTAIDAAIHAGYSRRSAKHSAYQLMHENELVMAELAKAQQRLADAADYNGERCMAELDDAIVFAKQHKQANAVVKAVELRARLAGLLRDKLDITVGAQPDISEALATARARALRPMCDPAESDGAQIEGEFVALPAFAGGRTPSSPIDNESTAPEFPPSDRWTEKA